MKAVLDLDCVGKVFLIAQRIRSIAQLKKGFSSQFDHETVQSDAKITDILTFQPKSGSFKPNYAN